MTTPLYSPGYRTLRFCGADKSGNVRFTGDGAALLKGGALSADDAKTLGAELREAASVAEEFMAKARGDHLWGSVGVDGAIFIVKHRGETARMRPVMNGRRRRNNFWECSACARRVATGSKMYVCEGECPWRWDDPRLCEKCVAPLDPIDRLELIVSFAPPPVPFWELDAPPLPAVDLEPMALHERPANDGTVA